MATERTRPPGGDVPKPLAAGAAARRTDLCGYSHRRSIFYGFIHIGNASAELPVAGFAGWRPDLIDLTLTANLILIVVFSAFENYIRKVELADQPGWPAGLIDIHFSAVKQKLLGSITGIAAVDALAWYLHLEEYADTTKLIWVVAFPLMFVAAMALLALADWLGRRYPR